MLKGERVTLRRLTAEDLPAVSDLFAVPAVAEAWPGDNQSSLREMVEDPDDVVGWLIEVDGQLIGFIQYGVEQDPDYRHASIDIALHPDWCNQGLGTEAIRVLAGHLFDDLGHHRIVIDPRTTNARAIASYRKVGFRDVGVMRQYERGNDGVWHDGLLMDLLRDELVFSRPAGRRWPPGPRRER